MQVRHSALVIPDRFEVAVRTWTNGVGAGAGRVSWGMGSVQKSVLRRPSIVRQSSSQKGRARGRAQKLPSVEIYTPRRLAEFLLNNAGPDDYATMRRDVEKLGLDPDTIPHEPPTKG